MKYLVLFLISFNCLGSPLNLSKFKGEYVLKDLKDSDSDCWKFLNIHQAMMTLDDDYIEIDLRKGFYQDMNIKFIPGVLSDDKVKMISTIHKENKISIQRYHLSGEFRSQVSLEIVKLTKSKEVQLSFIRAEDNLTCRYELI